MRSWLRFEETPFVRVSTVSASSICSGRILFDRARRIRTASEAGIGTSGTRSPEAAGADGLGAGEGEAAWAGAASGALLAASSAPGRSAGPPSAEPSGIGAESTGAATTSSERRRAASRSQLRTSTPREAKAGRARVRSARFASVGEAPRPISTRRSTPRASASKRRFCVSIQRTGEANCQARSSMRRVRPVPGRSARARGQSARRDSTGPEGATSRIARAKSSVIAKGRATRLGM